MSRSLPWTLAALALATAACGSDAGEPPLFEPKPECQGDVIVPFAGVQQQVISFLEIGATEDGFDLDRNGTPDNKLAGVGGLANGAILDSFADYSILIPIEMFDFPAAAVDKCVKFALYLGVYKQDADGDGEDTVVDGGDCNDHDEAIRPGATELAGNGVDDDCDGKADEISDQMPSNDTMDRDRDGVTIAAGDCDDTNNMIKGGSFAEICGDGYDNDCDGVADHSSDGTECNPYDATPDPIAIDPLSFENGKPIVQFTAGEVTSTPTGLHLVAGPSLFAVSIPVTDGIVLTLKITGTTIEADVVEQGGRVTLQNGRLGGVIDARTADTIRGLEVEQIGLKPEDSLLDAIFGGPIGLVLALPSGPVGPYENCHSPDIDVDRDGLELFCDMNTDGDMATKLVDLCVDGDGTEVKDEVVNGVVKHCTEAVDGDGEPRFVDGISVELNFKTAPANLQRPPS
jgi:hypothetical protein